MSTMILKIVEFSDGSVGLIRDEESEPIVHIRFSDTAKSYMGESCMEIASSMFKAGIDESHRQLAKSGQEQDGTLVSISFMSEDASEESEQRQADSTDKKTVH